MTPVEIETFLNSPCDITSWREGTWREWFADILVMLIDEGESFNGKRPNCDSGWQRSLAKGLSRLDPEVVTSWYSSGHPEKVDWRRVNQVAKAVAHHLCGIGGGERT